MVSQSTFRLYRRLFALSWQEFLAHRLNFVLHAVIVLVASILYLFLWKSLYLHQSSVGDFSQKQLLTYLAGALFFNGIVSFGAAGDKVDRAINRGDLNRYLTQPLSALSHWLLTDVARHIWRTMFLLFTLGILMVSFRPYLLPPVDLAHLLLTIGTVILAYGCVYHLMVPIAMASFWITDSWSIRFGFRILAEYATGAFIPLTFFPGWLQTICFALPFKFLSYIPMQIYLGRLTPAQITSELTQAVIWLVALVLLTRFVWYRGLRRYEGIGI